MRIIEASDSDLASVKRLFQAYAESLPFSLDFQGFDAELAGLPGAYAAPRGCLLLAVDGNEGNTPVGVTPVGVVGLKPLAPPGIGEIKRLYVAPEVRGRGAGKALAEHVIEAARARNYRRVRLDTHRPSMGAAIALYRRLGFVEIVPYGPNPGGVFAFFEKEL